MYGFQQSTCLTTNAKCETSTDLQNKDNQLHGRRVALKSRIVKACNWYFAFRGLARKDYPLLRDRAEELCKAKKNLTLSFLAKMTPKKYEVIQVWWKSVNLTGAQSLTMEMRLETSKESMMCFKILRLWLSFSFTANSDLGSGSFGLLHGHILLSFKIITFIFITLTVVSWIRFWKGCVVTFGLIFFFFKFKFSGRSGILNLAICYDKNTCYKFFSQGFWRELKFYINLKF